jgi:hypothetical protein
MVPHIPTPKRISKLLRLLSTPLDGEALGAVRALQRVLADAGANFHHLADIVEANWRAQVVDLFGKSEPKLKPWQQQAAELLKYPEVLLGGRERNFVGNMRKSRYAPTALQEKWMNDIAARRRAA